MITKCNKCDISIVRKNIVNGEGNINGGIVFIGESPGYYEDKFGTPFIGNSGKMLDAMLSLIGLTRQDVYVTNIIKCRPPNNRSPKAIEISNCSENLKNELTAINPRIIVLMGNVALNSFFGRTDLTINKLKGYIIPIKATKTAVIPIYHPSYIIRNKHNENLVKSYINSFKTIGICYRYLINPLITFKI